MRKKMQQEGAARRGAWRGLAGRDSAICAPVFGALRGNANGNTRAWFTPRARIAQHFAQGLQAGSDASGAASVLQLPDATLLLPNFIEP
ncbi:protein of unknown function [Paraburkholderia kururiensis]